MHEKQGMDSVDGDVAADRCRSCGHYLASARSGFTLIELSIVLVIIGLLVGGVLAGREMIANATLRAQISQIKQFDTAMLTFRTKYNCMPGDCTRDFGPIAVAGNGNGAIEGAEALYGTETVDTSGAYIGVEYSAAVDHLARAGLIEVSSFDPTDSSLPFATTVPKLKGGGWFVLRRECRPPASDWTDCRPTGGHTFRLGVADGSNDAGEGSVGTENPIYAPLQAFSLDTKVDDGMPLTGRVTVGYNASSGDGAAFLPITTALGALAPGTECVANFPSTNRYATTLAEKRCGLFVRAAN